jgi:predicted O-methyltransferase YrrM
MKLRRLDSVSDTQRIREGGLTLLTALRARRWKRSGTWRGLEEPFNAQRERRRVVTRLIEVFRPDSILETGTFLGFSASFFGETGLPVYTVEVKPEYVALARRRLRRYGNVTLICGDSATAVDRLIAENTFRRPFVYLDAHWWGNAPVAEEANRIFAATEEAVITVDDCYVPGDPGYGYDIYDGVPLDRAFLRLPAGVTLAYPAARAPAETGARRGALYVGHGSGGEAAMEALIDDGLLRSALESAAT